MINLNKHDCYRDVVRGAVASDHAVGGVWLELSRDKHSFVIEAHYGLTPEMLTYVSTLRPGDGSASGISIMNHHRVVIRDVEEDYDGKHRVAALAAGIRAVTATPLIDARFHATGVIAVYHAMPHHPSYTTSQQLDACCHVGAKLHEIFARHGAGAPSPAAQQAIATIRSLLPTCGCGTVHECQHGTLHRNLNTVLRELPPTQ